MLRVTPLVSVASVAFSLVLGPACHSSASEPIPEPSSATGDATGPQHHETHHIVEGDHRHILHLHVDDRVVLPDDPAFDWRVDFENKSAFARLTEPGSVRPAYRLVKAGPFRMMVYGDPKCVKGDSGCGISKRRWDVTVDVR